MAARIQVVDDDDARMDEAGSRRFHGGLGGDFVFEEDAVVPNGAGGAFGRVRFGRRLGPGKAETVVVKELLRQGQRALTFHPTTVDLSSALVIMAGQERLQSELLPQHVWILGIGPRTYAATMKGGVYVPLNLVECINVWGLDGQDSSLPQPTDLRAFFDQRRKVRREITFLLEAPRHPNLVTLLDYAEFVQTSAPNTLRIFLVVPYYSGGDLLETVLRGDCSSTQLTGYARDIINGLRALHDAGICHRDLKLDNVLLDNGRAVLADMGLADRFWVGDERLTCHGRDGTAGMQAPEVFTRPRYCGEAADCWSLAVLIIALFTSSIPVIVDSWGRPFLMRRAVASDSGFMLLQAKLGRLANLSPEVASTMQRLLDPCPATRARVADIESADWLQAPETPKPSSAPPTSTLPSCDQSWVYVEGVRSDVAPHTRGRPPGLDELIATVRLLPAGAITHNPSSLGSSWASSSVSRASSSSTLENTPACAQKSKPRDDEGAATPNTAARQLSLRRDELVKAVRTLLNAGRSNLNKLAPAKRA